ncbi:hypothetical protein BJ165DRAFT_1356317, partial [Panaeolus papilionaceus]
IDHVNNTLVVAMASHLFHIYDIRNMDTPAQQREISLKYMTWSFACTPDGRGVCRSCICFNILCRLVERDFIPTHIL